MKNKIEPVLLQRWNSRLYITLLSIFFLISLVVYQKGYQRHIGDQRTKLVKSPQCKKCDFFSGKWVYDDSKSPLYKERQCKFLHLDMACEQAGRKDLNYQFWRWKPHDCDLPRFNSTALLEKIRDKRLVFVGDSISRNQWMSMLCMLEAEIPEPSQLLIKQYQSIIPIPAYNATVEFYWSPMLVESDCDDPQHHTWHNRSVRLKTIEKHGRYWSSADILVFDSYAWWMDPINITLVWESFENSEIYKKVSTWEVANRLYEIAVRTWSDWLELNLDRKKTKLFFMSMSPGHNHGDEWGSTKDRNCYGETELIKKKEENWGSLIDRGMMQIPELAIRELGKRGIKVEYLNVTYMSAYRKEAHPSIYKPFSVPPSKEQLADPKTYSDCLHWCLPGVPDVWNQILSSYIINSE